MSSPGSGSALSDRHVARLKQRCRILLLLDAAERTGTAPLRSSRLHAFAYLADVLSPVWGLVPFDHKVYKSETGPHYTDLQDELDHLVVMGLVRAEELDYRIIDGNRARIRGSYALNFESSALHKLIPKLEGQNGDRRVQGNNRQLHEFLVALAGALAMLPDDQIDVAASADVTYRVGGHQHSVVDFGEWVEDPQMANPSWRVTERFDEFLPGEVAISPAEKLYLYTAYLRRAMDAA